MSGTAERAEAGSSGSARPDAGPDPKPRLAVDVVVEDGDWSAFGAVEPAIRAAAGAVGLRLETEAATAAIALCSDARVRRLNKSYRGKDKATNVLSFPAADAGEIGAGERSLGDIALAAETVLREADEYGTPPMHHLQHLVVHGLLHLLGYDHETDAEADAMEALEIEILAGLGIANPYLDGEVEREPPATAPSGKGGLP